MPVPFRFDTVLRVREAERDACRLALAREQSRHATLLEECNRVAAERRTVLEELQAMQDGKDWSPTHALARGHHAGQLAESLVQLEAALDEVATNLIRHRHELLEADTAVKALEKLAGRHHSDQTRSELAREERDRDDTRRSGRAA
jgi:flagellar export protein FliJ